jgi:hypothetical protein
MVGARNADGLSLYGPSLEVMEHIVWAGNPAMFQVSVAAPPGGTGVEAVKM